MLYTHTDTRTDRGILFMSSHMKIVNELNVSEWERESWWKSYPHFTRTHSHRLEKVVEKVHQFIEMRAKNGAPSMNFCGSLTSTSMSRFWGRCAMHRCLRLFSIAQINSIAIACPLLDKLISTRNTRSNLFFHVSSPSETRTNPSLCLRDHSRRRRHRHHHRFGCGLLSVRTFGGLIECIFLKLHRKHFICRSDWCNWNQKKKNAERTWRFGTILMHAHSFLFARQSKCWYSLHANYITCFMLDTCVFILYTV